MSSDWAKKLVAEREAKIEQWRIEDQKVVSDRQMVTVNVFPRWQTIIGLVQQFVNELNEASKELRLRTIPGDNSIGIALSDSPNAITEITFSPLDRQIRAPFHGAKLELTVNRAGKLVWQSEAGSDVWDEEQIAQKAVEYAWGHFLRR